MNTNRIPLPWMSIWASDDQTAIFHPATPWIQAADVQHVRAAWEIGEIQPQVEVQPAWQVADTEDSPGAAKAIVSSPETAKNVYYPSDWTDALGDGTAPTKSNMLVRFGWLVKKSSMNAGLALATVAGVVEYQGR